MRVLDKLEDCYFGFESALQGLGNYGGGWFGVADVHPVW